MVELPWPCPNGVYEEQMAAAVQAAADADVQHVAFGDLFLEDVRAYREAMLASTPLSVLFPSWGEPTGRLAHEMLAAGIRAVITCVDAQQAPRSLVGRWYDGDLLRELPASVDPCGERGEFHTFVADGPEFAAPINIRVGRSSSMTGSSSPT